jgi:hypothetical protein
MMKPSTISRRALQRLALWRATSQRLHSSCIQILPEVEDALRSGRPGKPRRHLECSVTALT